MAGKEAAAPLFLWGLKALLSQEKWNKKTLEALPEEVQERIAMIILKENLLTENIFTSFLPHLPAIAALDLSNHRWVPAAALVTSAPLWRGLRVLNLRGGWATDEFLIKLSRSECAGGLELIDLCRSHSITNHAFAEMNQFPNLRELNVSRCKHLTLAIAPDLVIKCSRLEGLKFDSWSLRDTDKFLEFLCQPSLRDEETQNLPFLRRLSLCLPNMDGVEYFLQNRKGIEDFTHLNLFDELGSHPEPCKLLLQIVQRCPKLTSGLPNLQSYSLAELLPVLAELPQDLEDLEDDYDQERFDKIVSRATRLKQLHLGGAAISDLSRCTTLERLQCDGNTLSKSALHDAANLRELELNNSNIRGLATQKEFNQLIGHLSALKSLRLDESICHSENADILHIAHPSLECIVVEGEFFRQLTLDCPNLLKFGVRAEGDFSLFPSQEGHSAKEPSLLEHLATHNPRLCKLRLRTGTDGETTQAFDFSRFSELMTLNASVRGLDDRSFSPLAKCCNLMKLKIAHSGITSSALDNILLHCKHLSRLRLSDCPNVISLDNCCSESLSFIEVSEVSIKTFKPMGLPNLRKVNISTEELEDFHLANHEYLDEVEIWGIDLQESMKVEIRDAPLLLTLRVDTMHLSLKLESTGLEELTLRNVTRRDEDLIEFDCPNLELLDMSYCKGWTFEMIEGYMRRHPELKRLKVSNSCTEEHCLALAEQYPALEEISWTSENGREGAILYTRKTGEDRIKRTRFIPLV